MRSFDVLRGKDGNMVAIKVGWSWPGFWFGPVWAFAKRQYALGVGLAILPACLSVGGGVVLAHMSWASETTRQVVAFCFRMGGVASMVGLGLNANKMILKALVKQGYEALGTASAHGPKSAVMRFQAFGTDVRSVAVSASGVSDPSAETQLIEVMGDWSVSGD